MKRLLTAVAPLLLAAIPASLAAQDSGQDMPDVGSLMQEMFPQEPLTAEQEARLPQASNVVAQIMPDGIYARMMQESMSSMLGPMMALAPQTMPGYEIAMRLGADVDDVNRLDRAEIERIGAMLDPAYAQRQQAEMDYVMSSMGEVMTRFEPAMRAGLSRAYAQRFNVTELADIDAFFQTPTGARYASESMLVFTDPQTMASMMEAMPAMMEIMPEMMAGAEAAAESLPAVRGFADLSTQERRSLAEALGLSETELKANMQAAEAVLETEYAD